MALATALKTGDKVYSKSTYIAPRLIGVIIGPSRKGFTNIRLANFTIAERRNRVTIVERKNRELMTETEFNEFTARAAAQAAYKATQAEKHAAADLAFAALTKALGGRLSYNDEYNRTFSDVKPHYVHNHRGGGRYDYTTTEIKTSLLAELIIAAKANSDKFDGIDLDALTAFSR
jgi:hypothetical protein